MQSLQDRALTSEDTYGGTWRPIPFRGGCRDDAGVPRARRENSCLERWVRGSLYIGHQAGAAGEGVVCNDAIGGGVRGWAPVEGDVSHSIHDRMAEVLWRSSWS